VPRRKRKGRGVCSKVEYPTRDAAAKAAIAVQRKHPARVLIPVYCNQHQAWHTGTPTNRVQDKRRRGRG